MSSHPVVVVLLFTLPALLVATVGSAVAAWRRPSSGTTAAIQHLAAGIVFAATALELLPRERASHTALPVVFGFAVGTVLMLGLRSLEARLEGRDAARRIPFGLLLVTGFDLLIDGLVLGMAFAAGQKSGALLAAALTLEVLFLALSVSAGMQKSEAGRLALFATPPALALVLCSGAAIGRAFFGALPPAPFAVLLGVGIVALLYLVTEELLVEAHEVADTPWSVAAFFIGFLLFLVIEMVVEA